MPFSSGIVFPESNCEDCEDTILNKLITVLLFKVIFKELEIIQISNNRGIKLKNLAL